ncbi:MULTISPECIES: thiol-disulfide oxidoreductase DCC family protein [Chryseobacterium]|uniref:DUF393 domain-containing protein n=2 Tax=Chryseobacterium TaxID=59732 RepID=A0A3M7THY7_9FLAO|nr:MULTISPECIES: DUF393 domain-containing protein [Chryseobacterium]RNA63182.1 DUF393 domain-containing protein [Chryseobacterium nematophagum]CAA7386117.1 hypothetical protein CHRY9393_00408 [Chryseobacterium fistulae]
MTSQPLIIYDSKCKFCSKFAHWCTFKNNTLQMIPVRDKQAKASLKELDVVFINLNTIYFIIDKKVFTKSEAVFEIMKLIPLPWKILSTFRVFPRKLTDYFYDTFAKYRYKIKI